MPVPIRSLEGFRRISLEPGRAETVSFTLTPRELSAIDDQSRRVALPGEFEITVGGGQPGTGGRWSGGGGQASARLTLTGNVFQVK